MIRIPMKILLPAIFLFIIVFISVFPGLITGQNPNDPSLKEIFQGPSQAHIMGTDNLGRDVLSRILHGGRNTLIAAFLAQTISITIGIILGSIAGYFQGRTVDYLISSSMTVLFAFPFILFLIALTSALGPGLTQVFIAIGLVNWISVARVVRGEFISLKEREFVKTAITLGAGPTRIIFKHILPNAFPPLVPVVVLGFAIVISAEAALSFLGLGVQPPNPSWGEMLRSGYGHIDSAWWVTLFPGLFLALTILSVNYIGEWLNRLFGGAQ